MLINMVGLIVAVYVLAIHVEYTDMFGIVMGCPETCMDSYSLCMCYKSMMNPLIVLLLLFGFKQHVWTHNRGACVINRC